jgi:hypothetical protein
MLLSGVIVFFASFIVHTFIGWHKDDFGTLPNEGKTRDLLRPLAIPPGEYMTPRATGRDEMRSPEFAQKLKEGPVMMLTVLPNGPFRMGKSLVLWFVYSLVISLFAAYVASRALPVGAPYLQVFRFIGVSAFLGYSTANWQTSIWYGRPWRTTMKNTVDGLLYALLTAGMFGWLWPR